MNVIFNTVDVSHEKLKKNIAISGEKRLEQKFSLAANGICNTQSFNSIYNANINDPSNNKFYYYDSSPNLLK